HRREADRLLEDRAPAVARDLADLPVVPWREDGHRGSVDRWRDRRREALARERLLDAVPFEPDADEAARRPAARLLALECQPADEVPAVEVDQAAHRELVGGVVLLGVQGVSRGRVVDLEQHEACLQPDDVEGEHARRPNAVAPTRRHDGVPRLGRALRGDPQLVAEVARVARARDLDLDALPAQAQRRRPAAEVAQLSERLLGGLLEGAPGQRTLERDRRDLLGDVIDGDVEVAGVEGQPAELGVGGGPEVLGLGESMDRAVVDDLAVLVAPGRVPDLPHGELRGVAGDHPVDERGRVRAGDAVLVQGRDVDQRGSLADRVVLDVVRVGVRGRGPVAGPLAPLLLAIERGGPRVERGPDAHAGTGCSECTAGSIVPDGSASPRANAARKPVIAMGPVIQPVTTQIAFWPITGNRSGPIAMRTEPSAISTRDPVARFVAAVGRAGSPVPTTTVRARYAKASDWTTDIALFSWRRAVHVGLPTSGGAPKS